MTSTEVGRTAETVAGAFLNSLGYTMVHRNWRTKWCEIDIIARKNDIIYLVEVKYRSSVDFGGGIAAVSPVKCMHMALAAAFWVTATVYDGDYVLAAIIVAGSDFIITDYFRIES